MRAQAPPPRGILKTGHTAEGSHQRLLPTPPLDQHVAHFWSVTWNVPKPVVAQTLPHPSVHLVVEGPRAEVSGLHTKKFSRTLEGEGWVFGIKFRPAMFASWWGAEVSSLANRVVPIEHVFGRAGAEFAKQINREADVLKRCELAEALLSPPAVDPAAVVWRDLVEAIAVDRSLTGVEHLVAKSGWSKRALQRGFRQYVGATPKWVIQRYRLHEAAERLANDPEVDLADLAADLGYSDQSHFVNDFKRVIGTSPGRYRAR